MPVELEDVQPGQIITAERWNELQKLVVELTDEVEKLAASVGGGPVIVPNVFGLTLTQAKAIITNPANQLALGNVVDAYGKLVNPGLQAAGPLMVINQIPAAGARTIPGAGVNLVLAAVPAGGGTPPDVQPVITAIIPTPSPVDVEVEIQGQRFASLNTDNIVTFDGVPAGAPTGLSNVGQLFVKVPKGVPGAPTAQGQPNKAGVVVQVTTPNGSATFDDCVIAPPPEQPLPNITQASPVPAFVGGILNLTGQNFAPTAQGNRVRFDNNPELTVTPTNATAGAGGAITLAVQIPSGITGLSQVGNQRTDVPVSVLKVGEPEPAPALIQKFPVNIRNAG